MAQIDGVLAELRDRIKRPFESGLPKTAVRRSTKATTSSVPGRISGDNGSYPTTTPPLRS